MRYLIGVLVLVGSVFAQMPMGGVTYVSAGVVTPDLVNFSGMPSIETTALGTKVQNTCATNAYCAPVADPSLAGNNILVFYKYKPASVNTADIPTVSSALLSGTSTGDTFTHCGTDANDSTNHIYLGCYYIIGATTGTASVKLTWANANTNVAVGVAQFYNANAFDVYHANTGTATTTFTAGSATSTANGDIWFQIACGTSTLTNVGAYTLGSQAGITWVGDMFDRRDACAVQHGIQTTAGALNAQLTGASNAFVSLAVAFKAGAQGTAPSGMYVRKIYHVSSASGSSNLAYQFPVPSGALAAVTTSGGAQMITGVSDTTNGTWDPCNTPVSYGFVGPSDQTSSGAYFFANSAAATLPITMTVSGTGDTGPAIFYDIAGANTTQTCGAATPVDDDATTGSTYTAMTGYVPSASAGITLASQSLFFNTALGSSLGTQDCSTVGGQVINGPSLPDQNNGCSHWSFSNNLAQTLTYTRSDTSAGGAIGATSGELVSFRAAGATAYPAVIQSAAGHNNASGANGTVSVSFTPKHAGDTLVVGVNAFGISTGTITVSDGGTNTYTTATAATTAGGFRAATFYAKNCSASAVTITATIATSNTQRSIFVVEVANVSTTAPLDQNGGIAGYTASSGLLSGPSITTTAANEAIVGFVWCNGSCDQANTSFPGQVIRPFSQTATDTFSDVAFYMATGATGTFQPQIRDSAGGAVVDPIAAMSFKQ